MILSCFIAGFRKWGTCLSSPVGHTVNNPLFSHWHPWGHSPANEGIEKDNTNRSNNQHFKPNTLVWNWWTYFCFVDFESFLVPMSDSIMTDEVGVFGHFRLFEVHYALCLFCCYTIQSHFHNLNSFNISCTYHEWNILYKIRIYLFLRSSFVS